MRCACTFSLSLGRLYNIIVDSDRTASRILSIMNQKKLDGEVTFLPLNKLIPPTGSYPDTRVCAIISVALLYMYF